MGEELTLLIPGAPERSDVRHLCSRFLSPLRGLGMSLRLPTACAVGCIFSPLRGWTSADFPQAVWKAVFVGFDGCRFLFGAARLVG
jgi:hypothetical protein